MSAEHHFLDPIFTNALANDGFKQLSRATAVYLADIAAMEKHLCESASDECGTCYHAFKHPRNKYFCASDYCYIRDVPAKCKPWKPAGVMR